MSKSSTEQSPTSRRTAAYRDAGPQGINTERRSRRFVRRASSTVVHRTSSPAGTHAGGQPHSISLILPTLDEVEGVRAVLPRLPAYISEVIVVDGGSADGTVEAVRAALPEALIVEQSGRGKGNALKAGAAVASGDIIVMMDADGSMNPEDIWLFVAELIDGVDFVKGSRVLHGAGSRDFTPLRRLGNTALTMAANAVSAGSYTDITFGFTAYWRETVLELGDLADGFQYEIQAAVRAARSGMRVAEVATHEPARVGGASKLNPITDGLAILKVILAER